MVNDPDDTIGADIYRENNEVVEEIKVGERGPNVLCGTCIENVVVGDDAVWIAQQLRASRSAGSTESNKVMVMIDLPLRAMAVSAAGGSIWANQFEDFPDRRVRGTVDVGRAPHRPGDQRGEVAPDPPMSVSWLAMCSGRVVPGRRGDLGRRLEVDR